MNDQLYFKQIEIGPMQNYVYLIGSNSEKIRTVHRSSLENCLKLEEETALLGRLRFASN